MDYGGQIREYRVFVPGPQDARRLMPVVFVLHGGGSNAAEGEAEAGRFMEIGARNRFAVVYPSAVEGYWNDGRGFGEFRSHRENVDDVGFLAAIIEEIDRRQPVDSRRVYATGESNGAFLCHRLAIERGDVFAAIAPVAGALPDALVPKIGAGKPVSVLLINDRLDPLLSFEGGVGPGAADARGTRRAAFAGFETSARLWVTANGCPFEATTSRWRSTQDAAANRWITHHVWPRCSSGTAVEAYVVEAGWHGWPAGPLDRRGLDAYEVVWRFFKEHPKPR
jgi:polyhydroxybutyrate depolymerase